MFNVSGKTARILAAFTAASVACVAAGCSDEDELASLDYEYEDEQMVDDAGNPYTLHRNEDGTETAVYDDGREVTFRRDENNNLNCRHCAGSNGRTSFVLRCSRQGGFPCC